jgi:hypothetical protein
MRHQWRGAQKALPSYRDLAQAATALLEIDRQGGLCEEPLLGERQTEHRNLCHRILAHDEAGDLIHVPPPWVLGMEGKE